MSRKQARKKAAPPPSVAKEPPNVHTPFTRSCVLPLRRSPVETKPKLKPRRKKKLRKLTEQEQCEMAVLYQWMMNQNQEEAA